MRPGKKHSSAFLTALLCAVALWDSIVYGTGYMQAAKWDAKEQLAP